MFILCLGSHALAGLSIRVVAGCGHVWILRAEALSGLLQRPGEILHCLCVLALQAAAFLQCVPVISQLVDFREVVAGCGHVWVVRAKALPDPLQRSCQVLHCLGVLPCKHS